MSRGTGMKEPCEVSETPFLSELYSRGLIVFSRLEHRAALMFRRSCLSNMIDHMVVVSEGLQLIIISNIWGL